MYTRTFVRDGTKIPIPTLIQKPRTSYFLKRMSKDLSENKMSMDTLAKTPVTKQDMFSNVSVVPL